MVKNPHVKCVIFQVIYMYHIQIQPPWTRFATYSISFLITFIPNPNCFLSSLVRHFSSWLDRIRIHWFRIGIQHFRLNTHPDPDPGFWRPKIGKHLQQEIFDIFLIRNWNLLIPGPQCPSYRRSHQPSKENIQHFRRWNFLTVFYFCASFLPSWIRYPDPVKSFHWPDLIRIQYTDDCKAALYCFTPI